MSDSPWLNDTFARESLRNLDDKFLERTPGEVDSIVRELRVNAGDRILDLGCGAGRHSIELAERGFEVTGIDISGYMLDEARKRAGMRNVTVRFLEGNLIDLQNLIGDKPSYEGAVCLCESGFGVLGRESDRKLLSDVHGALLPGSKLLATCFNGIRRYRKADPSGSFDHVSGSLLWSTPDGWDSGNRLEEVERFYVPSEIALMLELAGFERYSFHGFDTALNRKPLHPDDIEMMFIAEKD